jgi:hypothetical protein
MVNTVPDSTYGAGGTKTTYSDPNFKVTGVEYKDPQGVVKEQRQILKNGDIIVSLKKDGKFNLGGIFKNPTGTWSYESTTYEEGKIDGKASYGPRQTFDTKDDALRHLNEVSEKFAQDGTFVTDKPPAGDKPATTGKPDTPQPAGKEPAKEAVKPPEPETYQETKVAPPNLWQPKPPPKPPEQPADKSTESGHSLIDDMNLVSESGDLDLAVPEEVGETPKAEADEPKTDPKTVEKLTPSIAPDSTYGNGGSKTTWSGKDFKIKEEAFQDENGSTVEVREYGDDGTVTGAFRKWPDEMPYEVARAESGKWVVTVGKGAFDGYASAASQNFDSRDEAMHFLEKVQHKYATSQTFDYTDDVWDPGKTKLQPKAEKLTGEVYPVIQHVTETSREKTEPKQAQDDYQKTNVEPPDVWKPRPVPAPPSADGSSLPQDGHQTACLPRDGRTPVSIGSNAKVGSGARATSKALSTLAGFAGGFLGGGGGGGGKDGPPVAKCKIKDKEMTVFTDPATGIAMKVAAKQAGDDVFVFAEVDKSPDSGTFQTAFVDGPGGPRAPDKVDICDLWGEWSLTVSWTKTTYVNDQVVSQESGGYSKSGNFVIPGTLSSDQAPAGLWRQLGFSNASHGARKIAMRYRMPPADGPLNTVIHVTRPGQDPVTSQPFDLVLNRGPNGITVARQTAPLCPEEQTTTAR